VGASLELLYQIREYEPGSISKPSADRFLCSLKMKAFDGSWTPTLREKRIAQEIFAEQAARAAKADEPSEPGAHVIVSEVPTLTAEQAAVLKFLAEYRSDPHPYVDGMRARLRKPGAVPSDDNITFVRRRAPELFVDIVVHEVGVAPEHERSGRMSTVEVAP
jgi:hypothetical protein